MTGCAQKYKYNTGDKAGPPKAHYDPRYGRRPKWCGKRKVRVRNLVRKRIEDTLEKAGWCGKHIEHQRPDDEFSRPQHLDLVTEALSNMILGQTQPTRRRLSSIIQASVLIPPPAQVHPAPMVRKHIEPRHAATPRCGKISSLPPPFGHRGAESVLRFKPILTQMVRKPYRGS